MQSEKLARTDAAFRAALAAKFHCPQGQSSALREALRKSGLSREDLAAALGVSLRAVHRWMVEEENREHRAMNPALLADVLYFLADAPHKVEFRLPLSLTGGKQIRAARRRLEKLGAETKAALDAIAAAPAISPDSNEGDADLLRRDFAFARERLACAKLRALESFAFAAANGLENPDAKEVAGAKEDPIFVIVGRVS